MFENRGVALLRTSIEVAGVAAAVAADASHAVEVAAACKVVMDAASVQSTRHNAAISSIEVAGVAAAVAADPASSSALAPLNFRSSVRFVGLSSLLDLEIASLLAPNGKSSFEEFDALQKFFADPKWAVWCNSGAEGSSHFTTDLLGKINRLRKRHRVLTRSATDLTSASLEATSERALDRLLVFGFSKKSDVIRVAVRRLNEIFLQAKAVEAIVEGGENVVVLTCQRLMVDRALKSPSARAIVDAVREKAPSQRVSIVPVARLPQLQLPILATIADVRHILKVLLSREWGAEIAVAVAESCCIKLPNCIPDTPTYIALEKLRCRIAATHPGFSVSGFPKPIHESGAIGLYTHCELGPQMYFELRSNCRGSLSGLESVQGKGEGLEWGGWTRLKWRPGVVPSLVCDSTVGGCQMGELLAVLELP
jgi:Arc/MetJ-type ribon-helix-helix transcriptional regulator